MARCFQGCLLGTEDGSTVVIGSTLPSAFIDFANGVAGNGSVNQTRFPLTTIVTAGFRVYVISLDGDTQTEVRTAAIAMTYEDVDGAEQTWGAANWVITGSGGVDFGTLHDFYDGDPGDTTDLDFAGGVAV